MLKKIPYKTVEIYTCDENGYIVIKSNHARIVMNQQQSYIWQLINGLSSVEEIIETTMEKSDIHKETVINFLESGNSIGIIKFIEEEWDI